MDRSRIPEFYKYSVQERLRLLLEREIITEDDYHLFLGGEQVLTTAAADKMVENVLGVFGLPLGLGLNFFINGKEYVVPMAVEEPSIIAALSSAAKVVRGAGGFRTQATDPVLIGQVQVVDVAHTGKAHHAILQNKEEILNLANSLHPNMVARGGGARDVEVVVHPCSTSRGDMLVVHLLVDTRDAMGANLVNTMCEGVAPVIERMTGGKVFLRILSNLTDRSMVRAEAVLPVASLEGRGYSGEQVRDGVILANEFAAADPYRAATHNKGIMNGIDAVALASGNDWRAIEAAAHAYAGRGDRYTSLTQWYADDTGNLVGRLTIPLKVGTVGGNFATNPVVPAVHRIMRIGSAVELAQVMGAVGLAQNFSALRALATDGIQRGHMTLHARSVAMSAGAPVEVFDQVVNRLVRSGSIKVWKAKEIITELTCDPDVPSDHADPRVAAPTESASAAGHGKVVLLGEHAVVYGSHAIAAPVPLAVKARVEERGDGDVQLLIPAWGVEGRLDARNDKHNSLTDSLDLILGRLRLRDRSMFIKVYPHLPRAMGLGGSAALAVAVIRALSECFGLNLSDGDVNGLAFESEKLAHGTPSGIDNTLATYGRFILFQRGEPPLMQELEIAQPIPVVIGISGVESLTAGMVGKVRQAWENNQPLYDRIFKEIDGLTLAASDAIRGGRLQQLGELMNINQGLLNALGVSSWELEELIEIARKNGAVGAKLTGGGGGGSMVAITPDCSDRVASAMRRAGYRAIITEIGGATAG